ncbi:hypothetical protein SAMN05216352_10419 [Alteribacillus bidgolensis]|uniref:HXXEE domain-containing protein n=1 Tax=Alteribacillus bidgolensis TaxID=930129 RepID=A0A1G8GY65_9BACI|nr:HXXEE domain-containing protein [Alteribacillus bidgolensis]SDH99307.1 hypothetical protein SAMN05216352_10419 [Alteribacillus bidgolensis]
MGNIRINDLSTFHILIVLFPILYLLHDIEEIWTIEAFLTAHSNIIPIHVTAIEFAFAFTLLWVFASTGCVIAFKDRKFLGMKPATFLSFLVPGILLAKRAWAFAAVHFFQRICSWNYYIHSSYFPLFLFDG